MIDDINSEPKYELYLCIIPGGDVVGGVGSGVVDGLVVGVVVVGDVVVVDAVVVVCSKIRLSLTMCNNIKSRIRII